MTKEEEILDFLNKRIFNPALTSKSASKETKQGVRLTKTRMSGKNAEQMVRYFWSAVVGTDKSTRFAKLMKKEGLVRFEEVLEEFRERFNDKWLKK